jgi:ATP-binding cassette subfamily C protein CydC
LKFLFRLLAFLKPFWGEIILSIFLGTAAVCAGVGLLGTSAYLIASAALHPSIAELQIAIVGVRFFGLSRAGFRYLERLVSHSVNLRLVSSLRVWFYTRIEKSTQVDLQESSSGDLLDSVMRDMETLENFYVRVFSPFIVLIIVGAGVSLFVGGYARELGLILACGLVLTGFVLPIESLLLTKRTSSELRLTRSALTANIIETLQGLEDVQSFGSQEYWFSEIEKMDRASTKIQRRNSVLGGFNNGLTLLVMNLTIIGLVIASTLAVRGGEMNGISMAVITLVAMASFEITLSMPNAALRLSESYRSAERLFAISGRTDPENHSATEEFTLDPETLRFENVDQKYEAGQSYPLESISFTLTRGKKVAIVGPSGSGKSSIVSLILKFQKPDNGNIFLDGKDTLNLSNESVRAQFAVVGQDSYIFNCSLEENLSLARPDLTGEEMMKALGSVDLGDWMAALPNGQKTWLGEHGTRISGGEKQRIALARLILQNRPFLILDEPGLNLDPITKNHIFQMLHEQFCDKGMLWITHDLIQMEKMDEILFMEHGRIVEKGTHRELLAMDGRYAAFFRLQEYKSLEY